MESLKETTNDRISALNSQILHIYDFSKWFLGTLILGITGILINIWLSGQKERKRDGSKESGRKERENKRRH